MLMQPDVTAALCFARTMKLKVESMSNEVAHRFTGFDILILIAVELFIMNEVPLLLEGRKGEK